MAKKNTQSIKRSSGKGYTFCSTCQTGERWTEPKLAEDALVAALPKGWRR